MKRKEVYSLREAQKFSPEPAFKALQNVYFFIYIYILGVLYMREWLCSEILIPSFWLFNKCWLNLTLSVLLISVFPKLLVLWQIISRSADFKFFFLFIFYWKIYYCAQPALLAIDIILVEMSVFFQFSFSHFNFFPHLSEAARSGRKK